MKHLLNNMSEEEKNSIREQHAGGMKVMTENFSKLLNSKLGDAKPLVKEDTNLEPEPVLTDKMDGCTATVFFGEGQTQLKPEYSNQIVNFIKECIKSSIPTIQKFHNNSKFNLPSVVSFYIGTSSTGDFTTNRQVAEKRMSFMTNLYMKAMSSFGISEDVAYKLLVQSNKKYTPSKIDRDFYDPTKVKPLQDERNCTIVINPITTRGNTGDQIGNIGGGLIDSGSYVNNAFFDMVDEDNIVGGIERLQTYSDIQDLDKMLQNAREGDLESFLNRQLFDDYSEKRQIIDHLNDCAKRSGKPPIAKISQSGDITIMM